MTAEYDTDRQVRAWLAEGSDHAPERFVWAALDVVERQPQRSAWRTRLDVWSSAGGRFLALLGGATIVLVAAALALRLLSADLGVGGPGRRLAVDDLVSILVWETTKPSDWTLDSLVTNSGEVQRVPIRSMTSEELQALEAPEGYVGGRYVAFSGTDAVFMAWAMAFERDVDAATVLPFYEGELALEDGWGLGPGTALALGDGGRVFDGPSTRLMGDPGDPVATRMYLWRHGNVLLALGGWFDFDRAHLDAAAASMDQRAAELDEGREP